MESKKKLHFTIQKSLEYVIFDILMWLTYRKSIPTLHCEVFNEFIGLKLTINKYNYEDLTFMKYNR